MARSRTRGDRESDSIENRSSGDTKGLFYGLGMGLVAALVGGFLYQHLVSIIPLIYLNVVATIGLGAGIGFAFGYGASLGKFREPLAAAGLAALCGLVAIVVSFRVAHAQGAKEMNEELAAVFPATDEGIPPELAHLQDMSLGSWIDLRVETGWSVGRIGRSSDGPGFSGIFVWLIWLAELGIVCGAAAKFAYKLTDTVYCDDCNEQMEGAVLGRIRGVNERELARAERHGDLDELLALTTNRGHKALHWTLLYCPSCKTTRDLAATAHWKGGSKKEPVAMSATVFHDPLPDQELVTYVRAGLKAAKAEDPRRSRDTRRRDPPAR